MQLVVQPYFVYHRIMNANPDLAVSRVAAAIGEPARVRILFNLMDGVARTSTELAAVADVSPSTASAHLNQLREVHLVTVSAQGRHRYYSLAGTEVADALEKLSVVAGAPANVFVPKTPLRLRGARTCYDHIAGRLGVLLHDRLLTAGWIRLSSKEGADVYDVMPVGVEAMESFGIDLTKTHSLRRKFAYPCLDWSERRPHLGGALGAVFLDQLLKLRWVTQDLDSRCLELTSKGKREARARFGIPIHTD
jgi:DNA-binding transcriptional ArsR family regulator